MADRDHPRRRSTSEGSLLPPSSLHFPHSDTAQLIDHSVARWTNPIESFPPDKLVSALGIKLDSDDAKCASTESEPSPHLRLLSRLREELPFHPVRIGDETSSHHLLELFLANGA